MTLWQLVQAYGQALVAESWCGSSPDDDTDEFVRNVAKARAKLMERLQPLLDYAAVLQKRDELTTVEMDIGGNVWHY